MNQLPEKQFDVTFVRTQYATATVMATDIQEAWDRAKAMALIPDHTEVHVFPDYLQQDWKVDDVTVIKKYNLTVPA